MSKNDRKDRTERRLFKPGRWPSNVFMRRFYAKVGNSIFIVSLPWNLELMLKSVLFYWVMMSQNGFISALLVRSFRITIAWGSCVKSKESLCKEPAMHHSTIFTHWCNRNEVRSSRNAILLDHFQIFYCFPVSLYFSLYSSIFRHFLPLFQPLKY